MLDRSVQMQLIRRGGIKGGPRISTHEEADKRPNALRNDHAAEEASKRVGEAAEQAPAARYAAAGAKGRGKGRR